MKKILILGYTLNKDGIYISPTFSEMKNKKLGAKQIILSIQDIIKKKINFNEDYAGLVLPLITPSDINGDFSVYGHKDNLINPYSDFANQFLQTYKDKMSELPQILIYTNNNLTHLEETKDNIENEKMKGIEFIISNLKLKEEYIKWIKKIIK